jgi:hypothetical protein
MKFEDVVPNIWNPWTAISSDIPFIDNTKGIGNGEKKVREELGLSIEGGQNDVRDLPEINGTVKNVTNDNCRLGADSQERSAELVTSFIMLYRWSKRYKTNNFRANETYEILYPHMSKILRGEICEKLCPKLDKLSEVILTCMSAKVHCDAFKCVLLEEFSSSFENKSFKKTMDEVAKREAIDKRLIIVHERYGWQYVTDVERITCPRITQYKCRIDVKF